MGKVVNLRTVRKQKKREETSVKKAAVTAVSGVKKTEKNRVTRLNKKAGRILDGHKLDESE